MGSHPVNLGFRFLLEIAAYLTMGYWGWTQHEGIWRYVWAVGLPLGWAILWGVFAVPEDPSRSGKAPVPVPGWTRLLLEFAYFATAVWALFAADQNRLGLVFGVLVLIHYALSYDRILWLLRR
jgi:hypothetical protein